MLMHDPPAIGLSRKNTGTASRSRLGNAINDGAPVEAIEATGSIIALRNPADIFEPIGLVH